MRILIYCRVSTDAQAERGHSLGAQERLCREAAERRGDEVVGVVRDGGEHGDDPDRPGIREVRARLESGEVAGVYVLDLDRLHRDYAHHLILANELVQQNYHVYSVSDSADYADEDRRVLLDVKAAIAADELRRIRRRSRRGIAERVEKGLALGLPAYGYSAVRDERGNVISDEPFIIAPEEAAIVREIFQRYAGGESLVSIAKDLKGRGVRSKSGGCCWSPSRLGQVLDNHTYRGRVVHKDRVLPGLHEAIIDEDLWARVQARRNRQRGLHPKEKSSLSPLFVCGICGGPVHINMTTRVHLVHRYIICRERMYTPIADRHDYIGPRLAAVEAICWAYVRRVIRTGDWRRGVALHRERVEASQRNGERAEVVAELAEVDDALAVNLRAAQSGAIPEGLLARENAPLMERRERLKARLERIDEAAMQAGGIEWSEELSTAYVDALEHIEDAGRRREALQKFIERVEVWHTYVRVIPVLEGLPALRVEVPKYWRTGSTSRDIDL